MNSQAVIKELHEQDLSEFSLGYFLKFSNGDVLYTDWFIGLPMMSRMDAELKEIKWSKKMHANKLLCDITISPETDISRDLVLRPIFIDSKDQIWCRGYTYDIHDTNIHYNVLLDSNGELIWQKGYSNTNKIASEYILYIEDETGIYYYERPDLHFHRQVKVHIDFDGQMKIISGLNYSNVLVSQGSQQINISPSGNRMFLKYLEHSSSKTSSFQIFNLETNELSVIAWPNNDNFVIPHWCSVDWYNDDEFLFSSMIYPYNSVFPHVDSKLLTARIKVNGEVIWCKIDNTEISNVSHGAFGSRQSSIEGENAIVHVGRTDGGGMGLFTLEGQTGELIQSNFWAIRNINQVGNLYRNGNSVYGIDQNYSATNNDRAFYKYLIYDSLNNQSSCLKIPVCEMNIYDLDWQLDIAKYPFTQLPIDSICEPVCSLGLEIFSVPLNWREVCPEVVEFPDAYFIPGAEPICAGDIIPIIAQHDHNTFNHNWTLNGNGIDPVSVSNDTFYFRFDLDGDALLSLTTSRLGCESHYETNFHIVPGAKIEGPGDFSRCVGDIIEIELETREGFIIEWENGNNVLLADTSGIYTYTSLNTQTGCTYSASIEVKDQNPPRVNIDSFYSFCREDLERSILPRAIGKVDEMHWIHPEQGGNLLIFPSSSDTYFLRVEEGVCVDTIKVEVEVLRCIEICNVFIPDAFSPNDDGINDYFEIFMGCSNPILSFRMEIYDRWGNMVFQSNEFNRQWDGNIEGKLAPAGGYTYKLKMTLETENGFEEVLREGFVGLVR